MSASVQPDEQKVLSVKELTSLIKGLLEGSFPNVTVEGEISNCKLHPSGHIYFTLKDSESQISAVMFKYRAQSLGFVPRDGLLVQAKGSVTVYPQRGNYQIMVSSMSMAGTGDILAMLEERKRALAAEGLFDAARKRKLPRVPGTVGVVTSSSGAALRDIVQIARRRNSCVSITVLPCLVQGAGAAESIVRMIRTANALSLCDVLIVGRGGGSIEDLLPFSEESVVRAVAESRIPTISAVGHEIDWAISDFAADMRAPTPSAAAELAVPQKSDILNYLARGTEFFCQQVTSRTERLRLMIRAFDPDNMELQFRRIEQPLLHRFDDAKIALLDSMRERVAEYRLRVDLARQTLEACSPKEILLRGYSMVRDTESGAIIRSPEDTARGRRIEIIPASGRISAVVS